ncbi:nucleotide sugar dehydrogenase [Vibrio fluvialis]|uniref:nucleotide sugar dehydrogenase n=1 Tax=Vibrio fluvialis TaxID=676 RepID=UPI002572CDA8|nr:nucleotide sugar dehydrogenase [Vibrio fluvialis]BEI22392.1 Vi polysaccharide biosynthesis UDP-N-acetylglucosamine C-6 dehydrogenase TviB [Vibrio fluvialis]
MKVDKAYLRIGIIGQGYVGLPLAVEFGKKFCTLGFDISNDRVRELSRGIDSTLECSSEEIKGSVGLKFSSDIRELENCNVYIVTVPTPIDKNKQPDLSPLIMASKMLGDVISKGDVVIYESTVYPGATEETCIPEIEKKSGLHYNLDFFAGYSPERINPGDKERRVSNILKVTSGSTPEIADFVDELYASVIMAGTHKASSIKVAEASKVIENVQRDVNIALINELHQIFDKLNIDTSEVIEAASTKWNFMKLFPGLVGGHCIGVDPYYLLYKSKSTGYVPDLIRTSREINDNMSSFVIDSFCKRLIKSSINPLNLKVLIMGFSFKPNCPDIRNTKVVDIVLGLRELGFSVTVYDPWVNIQEAKYIYNIDVVNQINDFHDIGLIMVEHDEINTGLENKEFKLSYTYDFRNGKLNTYH